MTKKTFIKTLVSNIKLYHPEKTVIVVPTVTHADEVNQLFSKSKTNRNVYLIPKNENNYHLFEHQRICFLIHNGVGSLLTKNVNTKLLFQKDETSCSICTDEFHNNARGCDNCLISFCIVCQIKLIIDGMRNCTFTMKCPFCMHEHIIPKITKKTNLLSILELFINSIEERIYTEFYNDKINKTELDELETYLSTNLDQVLAKIESYVNNMS